MEIGVKYYFTIRYNASSVAILMNMFRCWFLLLRTKTINSVNFYQVLLLIPLHLCLKISILLQVSSSRNLLKYYISLFLFGIIYSAFSINVNVSHVNANYAVTQQVSVLKKNLLLLPPQIHLVLLYQAHQKIRYTEYH